ncbi:MAG: MopE-related protein [Pseudomonadota bacterium]|nr:MopE-related protein [Pseudomonadota bacterium]
MWPPMLLLLAACGPDAVAWRADGIALTVGAETLTFPATAVGATSLVPLTVTNGGSRAATVVVDVGTPFSVDRATVELGAGAVVTLSVGFTPTEWADAAGVLALGGDAQADVSLVGPLLTDADGDGAAALEAGGMDCDDTDATVFPGAEDPCGDDVDANCDPVGDDDCDQDGYAVGVDCDDADPGVSPGATETAPDGRDEDCDGRIDEVLATPGELVLTELAPQEPQWVEVCNRSTRSVALDGFTLETTSGVNALPTGSVASGACAVICASELQNCAFPAPLAFDPAADTITLAVEERVLDAVTIDAAWAWEPGWVWSLDPRAATVGANDAATAWCLGEGTPAVVNPACP